MESKINVILTSRIKAKEFKYSQTVSSFHILSNGTNGIHLHVLLVHTIYYQLS